MERADFLAGPKALLKQSARTTVLVIATLAAAVHAHASVNFTTLPIGNFTCSYQSTDCSGVTGDAQLPDAGGIAGVSFFTLAGQEISIPVSGGLTAVVAMSAGGTLSQMLDQNVPVGWDFNLSLSVPGTIGAWEVLFDLGTAAGDSSYGSFEFTDFPSGGGTFTGSGLITLLSNPAANSTLFETVVLEVATGITGDVNITAPFNVGSIPEPVTAGTLGAGLALLAWLYRRKRA